MPTSTSVAQVGLPAGSAPGIDTGHALSVRGRAQSAASVTLRMLLYQGATQITASALETDTLTTQIASYVLPITQADAAGISSYSGLSVKFWGYSAAGDTPVVEVQEVFLSLPATSVNTTHADRPSGKLNLAGGVVEFNIAAAPTIDTPNGLVTLAGGVVEFHIATARVADTPSGTLILAGRAVERATRTDARVGKLTLAGRALDASASRNHRDAPTGRLTLAGSGTVSLPIDVLGLDQAPGLIRTAMPGTVGLVQPGYFCTGVAIWRGPFDTEIAFGFTPGTVPSVERGQQLTVAPNVASQFAAGDATWFEFH